MCSLQIFKGSLLTSRLTLSPKVAVPQIKEREISLTTTIIADYKGGLYVG